MNRLHKLRQGKASAEQAVTLSIVVPLYDEEGNVDLLMKRLTPVLQEIGVPYEVILVNDGSSDRTWHNIRKLAINHTALKGINLSRNFGHQHALLAGLTCAKGQAVVTMDGDLQHPPEVIPELFELWRKGYAIVNTRRRDKHTAGFFKKFTSRCFYRIFSSFAEVSLADGSSDFRLLDRCALEPLLSFRDADLFLRGAVQWLGFSEGIVSFESSDRYSGKTKFSAGRMIRFATGAVISFSTKPLRFGIWLGLITSMLAFIEIVYIFVTYLRGDTVPGWASTVGILSFLFGILFVVLGIMGTYVARIHRVLQNRPKFIICEAINTDIQKHQDWAGVQLESPTQGQVVLTSDLYGRDTGRRLSGL